MSDRLRIAVIGGGISGISAAYYLSKTHDLTLFEKNDRLGGHTNTIVIANGPDRGIGVDTGFIVCNPTNYPNFYRFLEDLGVSLQDSNMSFGYFCQDSGLSYLGPALREFIQVPSNFLNLAFLRMLWEQVNFNRRSLQDHASGKLCNLTLGQYLKSINSSDYFIANYLIPLAASIWSSPDDQTLDFPAETFVTFFKNHGMLELGKRPRWQTVVGGSHSYLKAFQNHFRGKIHCSAPVSKVARFDHGVTLTLADRTQHNFDRVILAAHADESLAMLADPSSHEQEYLGAWDYHRNSIALHTDSSVLPPNRKLWASWNYCRLKSSSVDTPVPITYYMNRLQRLPATHDYFVTLNRTDAINPSKIIYTTEYTHPAYSARSIRAQVALGETNGNNNTAYCGSYLRYGFHEDGVVSALAAVTALGGVL